MNIDPQELQAMTAAEIKTLLGESLTILQTKEKQERAEERIKRRREYDRKRKSETFALTSRVPTREDAEAVKNLVKKAQESAKKNGWSLAREINLIAKDIPQKRRRNRSATEGKTSESANTPASKTASTTTGPSDRT